MKALKEVEIKNKILIIIIIALASGFLILQPYKNTVSKNNQNITKTIEKNNTKQIDCNTSNEIAKVIDENNSKFAPDTCLYVGCSGFTY